MSQHCIIMSFDAKQEMKDFFLAGTIFKVFWYDPICDFPLLYLVMLLT